MNKKMIAGCLAIVLVTAAAYASTKARWKAGHLEYFESSTQETVQALSPIQYTMPMFSAGNVTIPAYDGTAASAEIVHPILARNNGAGTAKYLQTVHGGGIELAMTVADTSQEVALYHKDLKTFDLSKNMAVEIMAQVATFDTVAAHTAEVGFGLTGDFAAGVGNMTPAVMFVTSTDYGDNWRAVIKSSAGATVTDTGVARDDKLKAFRIELYEAGKVRFWIDGHSVASGTIPTASTLQQPYVAVYKETGTAEVKLNLKRYHIWADR